MARREYEEYFRTESEAVEWEKTFLENKDRDEHIVMPAHKSNSLRFKDGDPVYVVKWEKYS